MRYLDVCAGISASSVAWKPLGWSAAAYSEIEAAPRAILAHRQGATAVDWDHRHAPGPNITPLFGDFTQIEAHHVGPIDLLVGGTPCQDFSIAGLRAGLDGDRGNLSLEFLRLADRTRPRWLVWENVPGVLSIDGGRAFGAILGGLGELGYGFAYRILDAQHFGVPQRRRRIFVVGYLGDHRRAAAVLFERHGLSGHPAPRREKGQIAPTIPSRSLGGGGLGTDFDCDGGLVASADGLDLRRLRDTERSDLVPDLRMVRAYGGETAPTLNAAFGSKLGLDNQHIDSGAGMFVAHSLRGEGFDASEDGTGRGTPLVPTMFYSNQSFDSGQNVDVSGTLRVASEGGDGPAIALGSAVRRLTPRECERLQGFPDDYTLVPNRGKPMADGPRYKALGNSMAVPVMRWIGERIAMVDKIADRRAALATNYNRHERKDDGQLERSGAALVAAI